MDSIEGEAGWQPAQKSKVANALVAVWLLLFLSVPSSPRRHDASTDDPATHPAAATTDPLAKWTTRHSIRNAGVAAPWVP